MLMDRKETSLLVVSYRDLQKGFEQAFQELVARVAAEDD